MPKISQGKLQNKFGHAIRHHSAGRLQKARQLYRDILKLDSAHNDSLHMLGLLTHQQGDNETAIKLLTTALKQGADSPEIHTNLGNALQASGKIEEAILAYKTALELNPDFILAHNNLGNALNMAGFEDEAISSFNTAISLDPNSALTFHNLGNLFYSKGENDRAISYFRQALTIEPEFADAINNLANLLAASGNTAEAIALFKRALKLNRNNSVAQHMLDALEGNTTSSPSPDYVINLFDNAANEFDKRLTGELEYKAPQLLHKAISRISDVKSNTLDIMDLGCGTGLCAPLFSGYAKTLNGIDLSQKMLDKARKLDLYDELISGDITKILNQSKHRYDLILSADVFIYVGDLKNIFKATAKALKPGALFALSLEAENSDVDFRLRTSGRYAHSIGYIKKLAKENDLTESYLEEATIRMDKNKPIKGYIVVLGADYD